MKLAADFRREAREALRSKWPMAILIGLVAALLGSAGSGGPEFDLNYDASGVFPRPSATRDRPSTQQVRALARSGAGCSSAVRSILP